MNIVVAGTFDIIHPGHIFFLTEASKYGDVYVIIARDKNVQKIKGRKPVFNEKERKLIVNNLKMVKKAVLGDTEDLFKKVEELNPDMIFMGPDQEDEWLKEKIVDAKLNIKIKHLENRLNYSSSWTKDILQRIHKNLECEKK